MSTRFPADIYTEQSDVDPDTLRNLDPRGPLAGIWEGTRGVDVNPKADGPEQDGYTERAGHGDDPPVHTIPRGQVALAIGHAAADARTFELVCELGSPTNGTCANPFLDHAFRTLEYRIQVSVHANGTSSYEQDTVLKIAGSDTPFHHTDRNTLHKVGEPTPNWLMRNGRP